MKEYSEEIINETRKLIENGVSGLTAKIQGLEVWFWGSSTETVSDEMIRFALDIVNNYQNNKVKYDNEAIKTVKKYLNEEVEELTIIEQLGTPIIDVATENGASLMYGGVAEIGDHMPEVRLNRDLEVTDVALNG